MVKRSVKDIAELWAAKRQQRRASTSISINLAPMMDIMFNLLVFFLVATSFKLPEGLLAARLPQTTGVAQAASMPLVPIKVYLEPAATDQSLIIRVSSALEADATTLVIVQDFERLFSFLVDLKNTAGITDKTPVIIAARDQAVWDQVVNAYNAAIRAKYKQVVFASWKEQ